MALYSLKASNEIYDSEKEDLKRKLASAIDERERANTIHNREFKEQAARNRAKLMSVFYMLDAISKTGTHSEKRTIIMYQKCVLEDLIQKGDSMRWDADLDLPF